MSTTATAATTMRAILLTGKPDKRDSVTKCIQLGEAPRPTCGPKEVLVKVKASALNIEDIMSAVGRRPLVYLTATAEQPVVLGQEFAGVVEVVGSKVTSLQVGDLVLGHKVPFRLRWGTWAEYTAVSPDILVKKPESYSFTEAAALPMSALVAYGAVKAAGFLGRELKPWSVEEGQVVKEVRSGVFCLNEADLEAATIAVIGASSTIGSILIGMLAARGLRAVGVCSGANAEPVLRNGAAAVFDRHKGGLKLKENLKFEVIFDMVGGQAVEDDARQAFAGGKGHFVTIIGPGEDTFGEGTDGGFKNIANGLTISSRSFKSMFSSVKYTLASMPVQGNRDILAKLVTENIRAIIDSEVDMSNEEKVKEAIDKVRLHKNSGRVVFVNS